MTKAVLYARVSTVDQTCAMQTREFREFCERRGWLNSHEYVDTGWSGAKASRPELLKLKADAQKHLFDAVVVWKLDRFGRSTLDCLQGIQDLHQQGIRFLSITQPIDTDDSNPVAKFLLTILVAVADLEREMIRERVMAGLKNAKAKGVQLGRRRAVFDRERARSMRAKGASIREIMRVLNVGSSAVQEALLSGTMPAEVTPTPKKAKKRT